MVSMVGRTGGTGRRAGGIRALPLERAGPGIKVSSCRRAPHGRQARLPRRRSEGARDGPVRRATVPPRGLSAAHPLLARRVAARGAGRGGRAERGRPPRAPRGSHVACGLRLPAVACELVDADFDAPRRGARLGSGSRGAASSPEVPPRVEASPQPGRPWARWRGEAQLARELPGSSVTQRPRPARGERRWLRGTSTSASAPPPCVPSARIHVA
jgi:hypothetical protein